MRRQRILVGSAPWCSEFGGLFSPEVETSDIYRIMASHAHGMNDRTEEPPPPGGFRANNVAITVPNAMLGKPLVHLDFSKDSSYESTLREYAHLCHETMAKAMCGKGGLKPDLLCEEVIFASQAKGWDQVRVPLACAFSVIPIRERLYFASQA